MIKEPLDILIAEDDEVNFIYFKSIFKDNASKIIHAYNGKEAVELCRENPDISFVIMDIKMPVMNGIDATQEIRAFRKDLPIVALTAYAMTSDEKLALSAGCNAYFVKPVKKLDILDKFKQLGLFD